jgi:hypothetical protein
MYSIAIYGDRWLLQKNGLKLRFFMRNCRIITGNCGNERELRDLEILSENQLNN